MSTHPRINDALAQLRLQHPTMPNALALATMFRDMASADGKGIALNLSDGSEWLLLAIDLEADTLKIWRRR